MSTEYLTTEQLAERIQYEPRTILTRLKDEVMKEGVHYIRPFGRRKILWLWDAIERDMADFSQSRAPIIPMAKGRVASRG